MAIQLTYRLSHVFARRVTLSPTLCNRCRFNTTLIGPNLSHIYRSNHNVSNKLLAFSSLLSIEWKCAPIRRVSTLLKRDNHLLGQWFRKASVKTSVKTSAATVEPLSEWQEIQKMTLTKKLWYLFKKYWYIALPVHGITSVLWFGGLYFFVAKSGIDVKPWIVKLKPYIEKLPLPQFVFDNLFHNEESDANVGYVAIAFLVYKLVAPARYATTIGTSLYSIKYLVKRGLIKPVPSKETITRAIRETDLRKVLKDRLKKREELKKQRLKKKV